MPPKLIRVFKTMRNDNTNVHGTMRDTDHEKILRKKEEKEKHIEKSFY